mmetsp:Transcript_93910/g.209856  ORF Transcript_93910/g.209856 Transcript_93910/m.209856 type:complete len:237 (+) Transcript_93910:328-1038(+)
MTKSKPPRARSQSRMLLSAAESPKRRGAARAGRPSTGKFTAMFPSSSGQSSGWSVRTHSAPNCARPKPGTPQPAPSSRNLKPLKLLQDLRRWRSRWLNSTRAPSQTPVPQVLNLEMSRSKRKLRRGTGPTRMDRVVGPEAPSPTPGLAAAACQTMAAAAEGAVFRLSRLRGSGGDPRSGPSSASASHSSSLSSTASPPVQASPSSESSSRHAAQKNLPYIPASGSTRPRTQSWPQW